MAIWIARSSRTSSQRWSWRPGACAPSKRQWTDSVPRPSSRSSSGHDHGDDLDASAAAPAAYTHLNPLRSRFGHEFTAVQSPPAARFADGFPACLAQQRQHDGAQPQHDRDRGIRRLPQCRRLRHSGLRVQPRGLRGDHRVLLHDECGQQQRHRLGRFSFPARVRHRRGVRAVERWCRARLRRARRRSDADVDGLPRPQPPGEPCGVVRSDGELSARPGRGAVFRRFLVVNRRPRRRGSTSPAGRESLHASLVPDGAAGAGARNGRPVGRGARLGGFAAARLDYNRRNQRGSLRVSIVTEPSSASAPHRGDLS